MRAGLLAATVAALAVAAAPAAAATPNRTHTFDADHLGSYGWTSDAGTGVLTDSLVSSKAGACTAPLQTCDFTLIQITQPGELLVNTSSTDQTLVDVDLHLYTSDANGTVGDSLGNSNGGTPTEAVDAAGLDPGYYLVKVDWFAGYGSYEGAASFTPTPPDDGSTP